eukprot:CAMPEP_0206136108 /NCGR_PEP_ID=MMETSP1473-20131121/1342_1 /ASSEMBLY_ACC=CAM_ASM_001109 /TAXON_ID=1461547 /ORGANISM="Stichococcus sp, Strain RCC1054" /LENGTH=303 /DNA_ID=CAMNT_0053528387 /DNA_START=420 /DNA_END=1331 /DNA_ORIENTATION=+
MTAERVCIPSWASYPPGSHLKIAIVTMTDSQLQSRKAHNQTNKWRGRNFEGVLGLTRDNKVHYAEMHGYTYEDASALVSDERPASWSKILAVQHYLKDADWVMWLDADTIVTNPEIRLESLLPRSSSGPDFIITVDGGGYNAGIWLLRRSQWSQDFLQRWWDMKAYVRGPGDTKSGDNDALKALLDGERKAGRHVGIAPQCAFNSYVWRSRLRDWWRLVYMPHTILLGLYRPGDFILHLAGIDDKRVYLEHALEEAEKQYQVDGDEGDVSLLDRSQQQDLGPQYDVRRKQKDVRLLKSAAIPG